MPAHRSTSPAAEAPEAHDLSWSTSPLGQVLVRLGVVDVVDVMLAAYEQDLGDRRRIGEILIQRGLAKPQDIELALLDQSRVTAPEPAAPPAPAPAPAPADAAALVAADFPSHQGGVVRTVQTFALFLLLAGAALVLSTVGGGPVFGVALYGALSFPYLLAKLLLSARYRAAKGPAPVGLAASVVVPFFNEDPETFRRCLASLTVQSTPPARVFVIDDGSKTRECFEVAREFAAHFPFFAVHRFDENRGKREAQAWAFEHIATDIVVTVDSDTVVHPDAISELLKPFADGRVNAVCGYARSLNRHRNLLTRLIDLRYTNSFLYERGAYSVLGSVLCSTGVLSAWRMDVIRANEDDYLNQTFLGTEVHYGDDRRLTAYALRTGRVVFQDTAMALTHVPERMSHFVRQQVRWNKSFFRESLLLLRQLGPNRIAWWLGGAEFGYWMVLTTMLLYAVAVRPVLTGVAPTWQYAAFVALMAYARSIRMLGDGGRLFPRAFLLAPIYGFMNLLLLVPLRLYSLLRLRDGSWGTRKRRRGTTRRTDGHGAPLLPNATETATFVPSPRGPAEPDAPGAESAPLQYSAPLQDNASLAVAAPVVPAPPPSGLACVNILPAHS
jgi:hyaluronan synthase